VITQNCAGGLWVLLGLTDKLQVHSKIILDDFIIEGLDIAFHYLAYVGDAVALRTGISDTGLGAIDILMLPHFFHYSGWEGQFLGFSG
jgi:hypothetical protein